MLNGRFKGGYTTRHYGQPSSGVHAVQMELACRGYMDEPEEPSPRATGPAPTSPRHRRADARGPARGAASLPADRAETKLAAED